MNWYLAVLKKYAVFNGRARRKEYWMFFLFNTIVAVVIGFVTGFTDAILKLESGINGPASIIYGLAVLIPGIAVGVRRMHDIGRSGWWIICPIVGLVFLFFDSQPGENDYGPNPKEA